MATNAAECSCDYREVRLCPVHGPRPSTATNDAPCLNGRYCRCEQHTGQSPPDVFAELLAKYEAALGTVRERDAEIERLRAEVARLESALRLARRHVRCSEDCGCALRTALRALDEKGGL